MAGDLLDRQIGGMEETHTTTAGHQSGETRWRRHPTDRVVAGVASGIARELGVAPWVIRVAFVLTALSGGLGIALYAIAWALMPPEGAAAPADEWRHRLSSSKDASAKAGMILIGAGAFLALRHLGFLHSPLLVAGALIVAGYLLIESKG